MIKHGVIGKNVSGSFSPFIQKKLGVEDYEALSLNEEELKEFFAKKEFSGINVTAPYKTEVVKYLNEVYGIAQDVNSINTVINKDGKLIGYNTDYFGIAYSFKRKGLSVKNKSCLILGDGGTAKTFGYYAKTHGAKRVRLASRKLGVDFTKIDKLFPDTEVLINATPVGNYTNDEEFTFPLENLKKLKIVFDTVYNPFESVLIKKAKSLGIKTINGTEMLVAQAKHGAEFFTHEEIDNEKIEKIIKETYREKTNYVLIGMGGSGKTSIGKILAEKLNREFIDTDLLIEKNTGKSVKELFGALGEEGFRLEERKAIKSLKSTVGAVISTGGGAVLDPDNVKYLSGNGVLIFISRKLKYLDKEDRPIYQKEGIKAIYKKRKGIYKKTAFITVKNNGKIEKAVNKILKISDENFIR